MVDEKAGSATFVVLLGGPTGVASDSEVTVDYAVAGGSATAGSDYGTRLDALSGRLSFAPGEVVKSVTVAITDDAKAENPERINFSLSNAINATVVDGNGVAVIGRSDTATSAAPSISVGDKIVSESDGYVDLAVTLSAPKTSAVSVKYATQNVAPAYDGGYDYHAVSGTLNFAAGETTKTVRVALTDDAGAERFETFVLNLVTPVNLTMADAWGQVFIVDDDTVNPEPGVRVLDAVVDEKAGTATYVVALGLPGGQSSANTVTVDFATSDSTATAGEDYDAASGTLSFAPGETVKTIVVDLLDDGDGEGSERIDLVLSNATNAVIVDANAVAVLGASDATAVAVPSISVADVKVAEADGFIDVVMSLSAPGTQPVTVNVATASSTATGTSSSTSRTTRPR